MDNQFIYCPKCSTRNFADDKVCGVCKTKLSSKTPNQGTKKATAEQPTKQPTNWKALLKIVGVVMILYFAFVKDDGTSNNSHSSSSSSVENYNEPNRVSGYYVNQESFATMDKDGFDEMYAYVVDNDMQALRTMLNNGQIVVLPKGTPISIVEAHLSYNVIRVKGYPQKLWIAMERVSNN